MFSESFDGNVNCKVHTRLNIFQIKNNYFPIVLMGSVEMCIFMPPFEEEGVYCFDGCRSVSRLTNL